MADAVDFEDHGLDHTACREIIDGAFMRGIAECDHFELTALTIVKIKRKKRSRSKEVRETSATCLPLALMAIRSVFILIKKKAGRGGMDNSTGTAPREER